MQVQTSSNELKTGNETEKTGVENNISLILMKQTIYASGINYFCKFELKIPRLMFPIAVEKQLRYF